MTRDELKMMLEDTMSPKRFIHSLNVMNTAMKLAKKYGEDVEKAGIGGLLHDCARDIRGEELFELCKKYNMELDEITQNQPELLHGPVGFFIARDMYKITDESILNTIKYHTMGNENMSVLDKIIFMADYTEPDRMFPGIDEIRALTFSDLDKSIVLALEKTIKHVLAKKALVHPDTLRARNRILLDLNKRGVVFQTNKPYKSAR